LCCYFFQAEDGIRDFHVTGVQTCALPIFEMMQQIGSRARMPSEILMMVEPAADHQLPAIAEGNLILDEGGVVHLLRASRAVDSRILQPLLPYLAADRELVSLEG